MEVQTPNFLHSVSRYIWHIMVYVSILFTACIIEVLHTELPH